MKTSAMHYGKCNLALRSKSLPKALAAALLAAAAIPAGVSAQAPDPDAPYVIYLRSEQPNVDNEAIAQSFIAAGLDVTVAWMGDNRESSALAVSRSVRSLLNRGISAERISVIGNGDSSSAAVLSSAMTANRNVNYVLLGECDAGLRQDYHFTMSGRVLGIHDDNDGKTRSNSCRSLWQGSPRVTERQQLTLNTEYGESLFDVPRDEWTHPVMAWIERGSVNVGEISQQQKKPSEPIAVAETSR